MCSYNPNENAQYYMDVSGKNHPVLYNIPSSKDSNGEHDKYFRQAVRFHHHIAPVLHDVLGNQIGLYCDQYFYDCACLFSKRNTDITSNIEKA